MHSIPQLVADIQSIAFSPRGNPVFIQAVMGGGVPGIINSLPHLEALSDRSEDEVEVLRKTCEQIIVAQWAWPYEGRQDTSLMLAATILPTLPARPEPEQPATPVMPAPGPAPVDPEE